jgi:two-component system, response regulator PdtaR
MGTGARPLPERVVLVVDDEEQVRRLAARVLTEAGLRVLEAQDGQDAVSLLAALGPTVIGLVVSDIAMPRMNGTELATVIASRWPAMPVLLVSGQGRPLHGYPGPFLPKPFTPDGLLEAVSGLLVVQEH